MWLESASRIVALVVTNSIKVAGLYVGFNAATAHNPSAVVLAFAAFMMAGGQVSETVLLGFLERFFGAK